MIKKVGKDGMYYTTKRCIHFVKVEGNSINSIGNCNIKPSHDRLVTKEKINNNINQYRNLKKCDWCLSAEDIEVE